MGVPIPGIRIGPYFKVSDTCGGDFGLKLVVFL